jgi:hypothetical protein
MKEQKAKDGGRIVEREVRDEPGRRREGFYVYVPPGVDVSDVQNLTDEDLARGPCRLMSEVDVLRFTM